MKRGDEIEVRIEKFADRGKSLARVNGYVVLVEGAVPGDMVRTRLTRRRKSFAEGYIIDVLEESPLRTEPRCSYFGTCGGCKWQHVSYAAQLQAKTDSVADALRHHGGFADFEVHPAIGSDKPYYYRNKMEYSFSAARWLTDWEIASGEQFDTGFALGLHVAGRFDKVLDVRECHLPPEGVVDVLNAVRDFVKERGWQPWDIRRHTGYLRHVVFRVPEHTDEFMINLVTNGDDPERMEDFGRFIRQRFPFITTLVNTINTGLAQTAFGEYSNTVFGPGLVHDRIRSLTFEIAPNAFFQTNTAQSERLYEVALQYAGLTAEDLVYDLYCGAGTISLFLAQHARHVLGVELVEEAVQNARRNAERNGLTNTTFLSGDLMRMFTPGFVRKHGVPDVLVVDPPRAGMHEKVVRQIAEMRPERFVYVSCNPMTQARDLKLLADVYNVASVQPVDLFPQTFHIENVAKLRLREHG